MSNDGCDAMCVAECGGEVIVDDWNGWTYWKVPVMGAMTDTNIETACSDCGLDIPCAGPDNCSYNDEVCVQTNNEDSCGNPMQDMASLLCNDDAPSQCQDLWGIYQYMGHNWINDSGCGAEQNSWCSVGNNQVDRFTLCVTQ
ncbi:hypothetical protein ENSA5_50510 [Enhygromyxa salina]|uniref:Uncharacterized protein n=2 Tax=Enhygromyxa salina TaxID=215803 RepID=A0A2S9XH65_9BACT|nr:hypothetical protein ENSA5_50510 [Enhygromyxa salina]